MARRGFSKLSHTPAPTPPTAEPMVQADQDEQPFLPVPLPQKQKNRAGRKLIGGHFSKEVSDGLKILAVEESTTIEKLLGEAINDLLRKYGKHPLV